MPRRREEDFFEEIHQIYTLYHEMFYPLGWSHSWSTIVCVFTLQMLHTKSGKDLPGSFSVEEDFKARRTTHDGRRTTNNLDH